MKSFAASLAIIILFVVVHNGRAKDIQIDVEQVVGNKCADDDKDQSGNGDSVVPGNPATSPETSTTTPTTTTEPPCESPSAEIDGLGCLKPVTVDKNFQEALDICASMEPKGSFRLLEGITSQEQLDSLKEKFEKNVQNSWIGLKGGDPMKWLESKTPLDASSKMWFEGFPKDNKEDDGQCGFACFTCDSSSLKHFSCGSFSFFLCQRRKP